MKLTKTIVEGATYQGDGTSKCILWEGESLPGFGVRVYPSGKKSFVLFYRAGRQQRFMVLGAFPVLTVQAAREKAQKVLASVLDGADPIRTRKQKRTAPTVAELSQRYLREHAPKKKQSSVETDERLLKLYILPAIGSQTVESLTTDDASRLHHSLHKKPIQANRVLALFSKLLSLAERWGMRPLGSNPCRHVERFRENKRERFLSSSELTRLGEALADVERDASEHLSAILAIRLLLLTGARRNEILTLRWSEVDLERSCLQLADSKTGKKIIRLGGAALELLSDAPRQEGNPYVCFGEREGGHFIGLQRPWKRIQKKAGLEEVRLHDLRHSFASVGAGAGVGLPILGRLLGHTQPITTARYAHLADDPLQHAADHISAEIAARLASRSQEAPQASDLLN